MIHRIPNINKVRAKGHVYYYHRVTGERLPDERALRAARAIAINADLAARRKAIAADRHAPGSFGALVAEFKGSPAWAGLSVKTRKDYAAYLEPLAIEFGDQRVSEITREVVLELRKREHAKPRKADYLVACIRRALTYALDFPSRYGLDSNPAMKIPKLSKPEGYAAWPDALIEQFVHSAPPELCAVVMLALFTGQRGGDCVKMLWSHYDGRCIDVTQEKTGTKLKLPVHRDLKAHLDALPRPAAVILTTKTGQPWRLDHLRHQISKQCAGFGFPGYSLHGLRVCAAKKLAEAGCSPHEVGAVLGHKTLQMVEHYARDAEHLRLARSAFSKWEDNRR